MRSRKKIDVLRELMCANDWGKAMSMAAKFPRLGAEMEDITRAHTAYTNPSFLQQIGKDPAACKTLGVIALVKKYSINYPQ